MLPCLAEEAPRHRSRRYAYNIIANLHAIRPTYRGLKGSFAVASRAGLVATRRGDLARLATPAPRDWPRRAANQPPSRRRALYPGSQCTAGRVTVRIVIVAERPSTRFAPIIRDPLRTNNRPVLRRDPSAPGSRFRSRARLSFFFLAPPSVPSRSFSLSAG